MDAETYTLRRNSRWTRDPVVDEGQAIVAYPTERDIEIFKLLARYRYLPSDYIHAFIGGNAKALTRRLNLFSRKPNLYLRGRTSSEKARAPITGRSSTSSTIAACACCASAEPRRRRRATTAISLTS